MDYVEVTIKQVADECGVSKSTAVRKLKEMNLPVITRGGKGTVFLGPEAASALAHALMKSRIPEVTQEEASVAIGISGSSETLEDISDLDEEPVVTESPLTFEADPLLELYREQVRTLREANSILKSQLEQSNQTIELLRTNYESTILILTNQVDRLHEQIATIQREKEHLRDDLAMSRALEGFHFPWQRDRIKSRYLLPSGSSDSPTYEMPS